MVLKVPVDLVSDSSLATPSPVLPILSDHGTLHTRGCFMPLYFLPFPVSDMRALLLFFCLLLHRPEKFLLILKN